MTAAPGSATGELRNVVILGRALGTSRVRARPVLWLCATLTLYAHGSGYALAADPRVASDSGSTPTGTSSEETPEQAAVPAGSVSAGDDAALPALVAYPTPHLADQGAKRSGGRYKIWVRWEPVPGAVKYRVQVSRTLDFERLFADTLLKRTQYTLSRQRPGVYFARVRAVGPAGEGTFGPTVVIDAVRGGPGDRAATAPLQLRQRRGKRQEVVIRDDLGDGGEQPTQAISLVNAGQAAPVQHATARPDRDLEAAEDDRTLLELTPVRLRLRELRRELAEADQVRAEMETIAARLQSLARDREIVEGLKQLRAEIERSESKRLELLQQIHRTEEELNRRLGVP